MWTNTYTQIYFLKQKMKNNTNECILLRSWWLLAHSTLTQNKQQVNNDVQINNEKNESSHMLRYSLIMTKRKGFLIIGLNFYFMIVFYFQSNNIHWKSHHCWKPMASLAYTYWPSDNSLNISCFHKFIF